MSEENYGILAEAGTIRFERVLPGPVERVWAYLAESGKRARWLCGGEMELRAGGRAEFHFRNSELSDHPEPVPEKFRKYEGIRFEGRITRCEPPSLLQFTWPEEDNTESEVTFELSGRGDNVQLVLTHRRLQDPVILRDVSCGWHLHLDVLAERLHGHEVTAFWSRHEALERVYAKRL